MADDQKAQKSGPQDRSSPTGESRIQVHDRRKLRSDQPDPDPVVEMAEEEEEAAEISGELEAARMEAASHLEDLQRLKAEFDNYRKRVMKEQTVLAEAASVALVARLLAVMDQFELAVAAAEETREFDKMLKGVEMVFGELKEVLRSEGLEQIKAKDLPFDPNFHEAALEVPGDDSGHVVVKEVLRPGYTLKGRVLRPAMVKVTQKAEG